MTFAIPISYGFTRMGFIEDHILVLTDEETKIYRANEILIGRRELTKIREINNMEIVKQQMGRGWGGAESMTPRKPVCQKNQKKGLEMPQGVKCLLHKNEAPEFGSSAPT